MLNRRNRGQFLAMVDNTIAFPTVHIGVLSARSYDRYNEALVMMKSILFNRKRPNILHFLDVGLRDAYFLLENFVSLKLPGLRISFTIFRKYVSSLISH